ncbi:hypothetical protein J3R82DRAFT_3628 [Butyriboletus roseoflavus]|nr:hypothetical protein J3R82DRAFT_3628 [Butyriboletus roseoflavus]
MSSPHASSNPASAFVEPCRIPPRPPVPVPASRVHLLSNAVTVLLCSREDLLFVLNGLSPSHPGPALACCPTPPVVRALTLHPPTPEASPSPSTVQDDTMSEAASSESSLSSLESLPVGNKIPKPDGFPGKPPGRGGYSLEAELDWDSTTFLMFKKFVYRSIKKHLDTTKCRSAQSDETIRLVIQESDGLIAEQQASEAFPGLEDYFSCWPVLDLILLRLRYTSGRARLSQRMRAGDMKEMKGKL